MPSGGLPYNATCCDPCTTPVIQNTPGATGSAGASGSDGADGENAYTTTTAAFTMPAEAGTVSVSVVSTAWMVAGQILYVGNAGYMVVDSITNSITVVLENPESTASSLYTDNVAPTTNVVSGSKISPGGVQGPSGALTGTAGGDLEGTYPNPTLEITTTKGDLIVNDNAATAPRNTRLAAGTNTHLLHADSSTATGLVWRGVDLDGTLTALSGTLAVTLGGTNGATATAGFDNLSPTTTRGDVIVNDGSNNVRLPVGASATVLTSDGTDPAWSQITASHIAASAKYLGRYGVLGSLTVDMDAAVGDQSFTISSARYIIRKIVIDNASVSFGGPTASTFGVYTNAAKGGTAIVSDPNVQHQGLTTSTKFVDLTLAATPGTDVITSTTLYVYLSVAHGSAATMNLWVIGEDLSS